MNRNWNLSWIVIGLVTGLVHLAGPLHGIDWLTFITKPIPMICLIALVSAWSPGRDMYRNLLAAGFVFSLVGDIFMAMSGYFLFGVGAFLVAHVFYIVAFSLGGVPLHPVRLAPFLVFGALLLPFFWPGLGDMRIPVTIYVFVILTMGWRAAARIGLANERPQAHLAGLLGAISFILSDSMIAWGQFAPPMPLPAPHLWIMITYWLGQIGIARSVRRSGIYF